MTIINEIMKNNNDVFIIVRLTANTANLSAIKYNIRNTPIYNVKFINDIAHLI